MTLSPKTLNDCWVHEVFGSFFYFLGRKWEVPAKTGDNHSYAKCGIYLQMTAGYLNVYLHDISHSVKFTTCAICNLQKRKDVSSKCLRETLMHLPYTEYFLDKTLSKRPLSIKLQWRCNFNIERVTLDTTSVAFIDEHYKKINSTDFQWSIQVKCHTNRFIMNELSCFFGEIPIWYMMKKIDLWRYENRSIWDAKKCGGSQCWTEDDFNRRFRRQWDMKLRQYELCFSSTVYWHF